MSDGWRPSYSSVIPTLAVWASFAYIDLGWALFEVMAVVSFVEWRRGGDRTWLVGAGLFAGMAMGSKYLAVTGFGLLTAAVGLCTIRAGWRKTMTAVLSFTVPAVLLALPWYLKNAVWFGNPIFPHVLGGGDWSVARLHNYTAYLNSFGAGKSLLALLALPWNLYAHHELFGTVMSQIDLPSLMFLALVFYPFVRRNRLVSLLLLLSLARIVLWFLGSQQVRFLLPIMPWLALASAYVIVHMKGSLHGRRLRLWSLWEPLAVAVAAVPVLLQLGMLPFSSARRR